MNVVEVIEVIESINENTEKTQQPHTHHQQYSRYSRISKIEVNGTAIQKKCWCVACLLTVYSLGVSSSSSLLALPIFAFGLSFASDFIFYSFYLCFVFRTGILVFCKSFGWYYSNTIVDVFCWCHLSYLSLHTHTLSLSISPSLLLVAWEYDHYAGILYAYYSIRMRNVTTSHIHLSLQRF